MIDFIQFGRNTYIYQFCLFLILIEFQFRNIFFIDKNAFHTFDIRFYEVNKFINNYKPFYTIQCQTLDPFIFNPISPSPESFKRLTKRRFPQHRPWSPNPLATTNPKPVNLFAKTKRKANCAKSSSRTVSALTRANANSHMDPMSYEKTVK